MSKRILPLLFVLAVAVLIAGCGKSAQMKQMEADLYKSVTSMHDEGMALMNKANEALAGIDAAIAENEKLAAAHPKEVAAHSMDDLTAAKQKLNSAVVSMKEWMSGFKPYDPEKKHEEVMAELTKTKDGIAKVKVNFDEAIAAAKTAVDTHTAFAAELMAKVPAKKAARK
jgi:paraquat-inducible protein B